MISIKEAYGIAQKTFPQHEFVTYTETKEYYMFCIGDPTYWARVNKNTGIPDEEIFSQSDYVFSQFFSVDANNNIIDDKNPDMETIDELNTAIRNSKPISDLIVSIAS